MWKNTNMRPVSERRPNRLISEKSPYLLQHAYNPVDWYPWGEAAFSRALIEDKPVFLSIGYSTCHWCHVMERESFEDPEIARLMNDTFVCVKVDREERPDIDKAYMTACQMMTGTGGWPLSIIMTPEKRPFFATTYVPRESMFGRIGMKELIPNIQKIWELQRDKVYDISSRVVNAFNEPPLGGEEELDKTILDEAYERLLGSFDVRHGGFGSAPKFPTPEKLTFLLRYWNRTGNENALQMVEKTLSQMRQGGIYDHVGFGFHRYSTDSAWILPHFEKMLYDQALISIAYTEAYQVTKKETYSETVRQILEYVRREMTSSDGAFFSAEDADSEGVEGKYYLWTLDEIEKILPPREAEVFARAYSVTRTGNLVGEY
ncbi:MAG: thioredoxin domain-containing protein, partial [Methanomassiliicoccales archaeon]|nr:thioredoxin domain-containing protein [Methanomassiliicoccales archaeon]